MHRAPGAVVEREEGKQVERMEKRIKREERGGGGLRIKRMDGRKKDRKGKQWRKRGKKEI